MVLLFRSVKSINGFMSHTVYFTLLSSTLKSINIMNEFCGARDVISYNLQRIQDTSCELRLQAIVGHGCSRVCCVLPNINIDRRDRYNAIIMLLII